MFPELKELWKYAPVLAVLLLVLWAGSKGLWFWGPGVRAYVRTIEQQRDEWRRLALALLKKQGIEIDSVAPLPPSDASQERNTLR